MPASLKIASMPRSGSIAHLGERCFCKAEVVGSSPTGSTTGWFVSFVWRETETERCCSKILQGFGGSGNTPVPKPANAAPGTTPGPVAGDSGPKLVDALSAGM